jgi:hypothetical protein
MPDSKQVICCMTCAACPLSQHFLLESDYMLASAGIIQLIRNLNAVPAVHSLSRHFALTRRSEVFDNARLWWLLSSQNL